MFRRYTAETRRNYVTDIALLLTFLWGRGKVVDRRGGAGPGGLRALAAVRRGRTRTGSEGSKWDRELAAFASLYGWAAQERARDAEPCGDEAGPRPERRRGDGAGGAGEGRPAVATCTG